MLWKSEYLLFRRKNISSIVGVHHLWGVSLVLKSGEITLALEMTLVIMMDGSQGQLESLRLEKMLDLIGGWWRGCVLTGLELSKPALESWKSERKPWFTAYVAEVCVHDQEGRRGCKCFMG